MDIIEETLQEQGNLIDSKIYKLLKQFQSKKESTQLQNKFKDSGESFDFDEMLKWCDVSSSTRSTSSLLHTILESNTDFSDAVKKIISDDGRSEDALSSIVYVSGKLIAIELDHIHSLGMNANYNTLLFDVRSISN